MLQFYSIVLIVLVIWPSHCQTGFEHLEEYYELSDTRPNKKMEPPFKTTYTSEFKGCASKCAESTKCKHFVWNEKNACELYESENFSIKCDDNYELCGVITKKIVSSISTYFLNSSSEGHYMRLTCSVQSIANGTIFNSDIVWYKDGEQLNETLKKSLGIKIDPYKSNLLIVQKLSYEKHNGNYECGTKIEDEVIMSVAHPILVNFGPNLINNYKDNQILVHKVGEVVQLYCPVQGYPLTPYYPEWSHKKANLLGSENVHMDIDKVEKKSLFIRQTNAKLLLTRHHNGTYICNAENSINGERQIKIDLIVQSKPSGILFTKFKKYDENSAMIEWAIEDNGELNISCIEIAINKSKVMKNGTKLEVITKCGHLNHNYFKLTEEIKDGYVAKIRLNNSMGYSEYSNELVYPSVYGPAGIKQAQTNIDNDGQKSIEDDKNNNKLLNPVLIISVGALVFLATLIFAIALYKKRKSGVVSEKYTRTSIYQAEMKRFSQPPEIPIVYNLYGNVDGKYLASNEFDNNPKLKCGNDETYSWRTAAEILRVAADPPL